MTRLHYVKKAKKSVPGTCVKKGKPYYYWKFYPNIKHYSLTPPKRSALVRSPYLKAMMDLEDQFNEIELPPEKDEDAEADGVDADDDTITPENVRTALEDIESELESMMEEEQTKFSAMEERFPGGCPSMETVGERITQCESLKDTIRSAIDLIEDDSTRVDIESALSGVSWEYS